MVTADDQTDDLAARTSVRHIIEENPEAGENITRCPWWKRPSPWWQIFFWPATAIAKGCVAPAALELVNMVVCRELLPDLGRTAPALPSRCGSNPGVQSGAASLLAAMMALAGTIACLTAPIWGSASDRHGRVYIQRLYAFGPLTSCILVMLVYLLHERYSAVGRPLIILASITEGLFAVGTVTPSQSYIADVTTPDTRARWYALFQGVTFIGYAVGPLVSSTVAHFTGSLLFVFVIALGLHFIFMVATWTLIPESLTPAQIEAARTSHQREATARRNGKSGILPMAKAAVWNALEPLSIFIPSKSTFGPTARMIESRSWDMLLVGLAYFSDAVVQGANIFYIQYGIGVFNWTTEDMGVVLSLDSSSKVIFLLLVLPWAIRMLRPSPGSLPFKASSLSSDSTSAQTTSERTQLLSHPRDDSTVYDAGFKWDLSLLLISLILQLAAFLLMGFAVHPWVFIAGIIAVSLSSGFVPVTQSFALELYRRRGGVESGKLFGALSAVLVLGSQIVCPVLFGISYSKSVETVPKFIFFLGSSLVMCSSLALVFIRLPPDYSSDSSPAPNPSSRSGSVLEE